jgi:hypothetical protein
VIVGGDATVATDRLTCTWPETAAAVAAIPSSAPIRVIPTGPDHLLTLAMMARTSWVVWDKRRRSHRSPQLLALACRKATHAHHGPPDLLRGTATGRTGRRSSWSAVTTDVTTATFAHGTAPVGSAALFEIFIKATPERI